MHQFRSRQFQALRDGAHDITHMESKVMGFFARHPGATLSDLVAHSGRDKAQLAKLVKGLRERGLLDGRADADDRRNVRLRLSARAGRCSRRCAPRRTRSTRRRSPGSDATEQAQLIELLGGVKAQSRRRRTDVRSCRREPVESNTPAPAGACIGGRNVVDW